MQNQQRTNDQDPQLIAELIPDDLKDIRACFNDSYRERRLYEIAGQMEQVEFGSKHIKPKFARFKMRIRFLDSNVRYFYGYDYHKTHEGSATRLKDEWIALSALKNYTYEKIEKIAQVKIWANMTDEKPNTNEKKYEELVYESWLNSSTGEFQFSENPKVGFCVVDNSHVLRYRSEGGK